MLGPPPRQPNTDQTKSHAEKLNTESNTNAEFKDAASKAYLNSAYEYARKVNPDKASKFLDMSGYGNDENVISEMHRLCRQGLDELSGRNR